MTTIFARETKPFPANLLAGGLALTALALMAMVWSAVDSYRNVATIQQRDLRTVELRGKIIYLDEVLTMSAFMAAATGDLSWEERYRRHEIGIDAAVKEAMTLSIGQAGREATAQTDAANLKLVEMENRAFSLVREKRMAEAWAILTAETYDAQKKIYAERMAGLRRDLTDRLTDNQRRKRRATLLSMLVVALSLTALAFTWWRVLGRLSQWRSVQKAGFAAATRAEQALRDAQSHLEQRVAERTQALRSEVQERIDTQLQLERTQSELMETSRKAGMAEVATGVLHNVGNVLNSVNVSAALISDKVRQGKGPSLTRVCSLLREHSTDLGSFLTKDPKGQQVPAFLETLSESLAADRLAILHELAQLARNIEHIKEIVSMQQSYARVSRVAEAVQITDLIEESLEMNASSLARHDIRVVRDYGEVPTVSMEKHKVLQILVNLIRNADHACEESGRPDKQITVRVRLEGGRVQLAVIDNGVGIPPENLTRIFNHGFTTRKDGHGFGLHSGALAAKGMEASLQVQSEGLGRGATFTLELPASTQHQIAA